MSKKDFLNSMNKITNLTETSNGAITNKSSFNALLDFFGQAGAMRNRSEEDIIHLFNNAYVEDKLRAIKCVFYLGDILKGQGERRTYTILLKYIANNYPNDLKENIHLIPHYNRWDSIYALFDTPLESDAAKLIKTQITLDLSSSNPSLCAKWLKSTKCSSSESRKLGRKTAKLINLNNFTGNYTKQKKIENEISYRKALATLRDKINIVEKIMSQNKWENINYSHIPSKAMDIYKEAFNRHDEARFISYCEDLALSKATINSKALYPYEIVKKILRKKYSLSSIDKAIATAQWNALPNFINNKEMKGLCVVDVSGSMFGTPMEVAISTGLYVSENCSGTYHNKFITFSEEPEIVSVKGNTIVEKVVNLSKANWGYCTNLEAVFNLILDTAIANNAPQEDMPNYLIIITDMGFDRLQGDPVTNVQKKTLIESMKAKFEAAGYTMPVLVLWNVDASDTQMPMTADDNGWISISGYSPSIFKALLSEELLGAQDEEFAPEKINPVDAMLVVLDSERYSLIK